MSTAYADVMKEAFKPASDEMVIGFKRKLKFIQENSPHSKKTVECCLEGISEKPTLVELLAAAYLVNGGLVFKHDDPAPTQVDENEDTDYAHLLKEMEELNCTPSPAVKVSAPAGTSTEFDIFGDGND